jgi:hypothetical protein
MALLTIMINTTTIIAMADHKKKTKMPIKVNNNYTIKTTTMNNNIDLTNRTRPERFRASEQESGLLGNQKADRISSNPVVRYSRQAWL